VRAAAVVLALAAAGAVAQDAGEPIPKADLQLVSDAVRYIRRDYARETDDAALASACADALAAASGSSERAARSLEALPGLLMRARAATRGEITYRKLADRCIAGMVGTLDKHSEYLDEEEARLMYRGAPGVAATGLELRKNGKDLVAVDVYDDSPAAKAGMRVGDVILMIDGVAADSLSLRDAVLRLRGAAGSTVALQVMRPGTVKPMELVAKREVIRIQSVRVRWLEGDVLELQVNRLVDSTRAELQREIMKIAGSPPRAPRGILLDLRANSGGLLTVAVDLAGLFLEKGAPVGSTRGRRGRMIAPYTAGEHPSANRYWSYQSMLLPEPLTTALRKAPLIVLVAGRTASGAEILAAALQVNGRARLAGERSFGRGSIQTLFPLGVGAGPMLKLTTAYWYGPKDVELDGAPLEPELPASEEGARAAALAALGQAAR